MKRSRHGRGPGARRHSTAKLKVTNSNNPLPLAQLPPALGRLTAFPGGPENLTDLELIELVLSLAGVPANSVKMIAFSLIAEFGSYAKAISAPSSELQRIEGLGALGITALKVVSETMVRMLRIDIKNGPVINHWDKLIRYLTVLFAQEEREKFHCLYLDIRNRLIADELVAVGTVNALTIYPREIIKRALALNATALILVHNHPSLGPKPSPADFDATKGIKDAAANIGIVLHDSIIIAGAEWYSFREDGRL